MIRRIFRFLALAGIAAGVVAAVRALTRDSDPLPAPAAPSNEPWPPPPSKEPAATKAPTPAPAPKPSTGAAFAEPTDDGDCPDGFPIKAKMSSKIFHSPGQLNYDRTAPDRCYVDASAAEADGLRAAKR